MSFGSELVVARWTDTTWKLTKPLTYHGARDSFTVPAGHVTDFASVPRFLQWLTPSTGKYTLAAVVHDWLCDSMNHQGYMWSRRTEYEYQPAALTHPITSREADGVFRRIMREQGVPVAQRWMMWCGVRWGALFNPRRRPGILHDLPLVLLLSVLALPLVLPASVCIGVALVIQQVYDRVAEFATGARRWIG